jgi:uncharacterized protein
MRKLTATICLTIAVLLGVTGVSWGAESKTKFNDEMLLIMRDLHERAKRGEKDALFELGNLYRMGKKYKLSLQLLELSALKGHPAAQHNLGYMYYAGIGTKKNYDVAFKWFRLAADNGHAPSQQNLGEMYAKGQGVPQNRLTAKNLWLLAAKQENAFAMNSLGNFYGLGWGGKVQFVRSYMWYSIAASKGHKRAIEQLKRMPKIMTQRELEEGKDLARECVRKKYKGC